MRRAIIIGGVVLGLSLGLYLWISPTATAPVLASTVPVSRREYGAAFLGLMLLFLVAFGMDWQDWM